MQKLINFINYIKQRIKKACRQFKMSVGVRGMQEIYPQTNGEISESITQNWTEQALECYSINCDCKKCSLSKGNYSFICQMPKVIEALISTTGKPQAA